MAGLLSHIGLREGDSRDYQGARNSKFVLAPGFGADQAPAALDRGRRPGRDQPAVRPDRGAHRAGVRRTRRRAPRAAHVQRAALGRPTRRGDGLRAGDALRAAAGGAPPGRLRDGASRELARELFIRHALVEGDWQTRHHFFRDNAAAACGTGRDSRSGPDAATCSSATTRSTRSTTRASPPTSFRRGTSTRGGRSSGTRRRTC